MSEKWIKIHEIKYSHEDLSSIYGQIEEKDLNENTEKLEELIKDKFLIQVLKNNSIPYKCRWSERLMDIRRGMPTAKPKRVYKYFVEILILESYKLKYDSILNEVEIPQENHSFEELSSENAEESNEYEPFKKVKHAYKIFMNGLLILTAGCIIYIIIQSILNN